jgi:prostaglandin-H2 D-isomerase / glutathione transferase
MTAQPHIKLTYFDFPASRGEECRLALHVAGVEFEDHRLKNAEWAALKPTTPYGSLPLLEVEGKGVLAQSNAILAYIGRTWGALPADPWEAARHEAVMSAVEELRAKLDPSMRTKDDAEKKRMREELVAGWMQTWFRNVDAQVAGPFFGGERVSVADIKLFVVLNWFAKGTLDHVPREVFSGFPRLVRLFESVKSHPRVLDWQARTTG